MNLYVRLLMVTSWRARDARLLCSCSPCAVPWRHSGNTLMQPHADLQQRTCAREGGAPSLGPAWCRSHAGPNLTSLPSGRSGSSAAHSAVMGGGVGGVDGHARGRPRSSRLQDATHSPVPPGWPMGEVLIRFLKTDEPRSGNRPSLESRPVCSLAHLFHLFTPAPHRQYIPVVVGPPPGRATIKHR